jgi:hypothetical protein
MLSANSLFHRADIGDGGPALPVIGVGFESYPITPQDLERMPKQQVLGIGINRGPLLPWREPRVTDLHHSVRCVDFEISRAANDFSSQLVKRGEGQINAAIRRDQ